MATQEELCYSLIAGENIKHGQPVCVCSDGKAYVAIAEDSTKRPAIGLSMSDSSKGENCKILPFGAFLFSNLTISPGQTYYLGSGEISLSHGSFIQRRTATKSGKYLVSYQVTPNSYCCWKTCRSFNLVKW